MTADEASQTGLLPEKDDGTFVCMYYWATAELQRQHIAATTFGPPGRAAL